MSNEVPDGRSVRVKGLVCVCGAVIDDAGADDLLAAVEQHLRESHGARLSEGTSVEGDDKVAQLNDEGLAGSSYGAPNVNRTGGRP